MPAAVCGANAQFLKSLKLSPSSKIIKAADNQNFEIMGEVDFDLQVQDKFHIPLENVPVLQNLNFDLIIGLPILSKLGFSLPPKNESFFTFNGFRLNWHDQKVTKFEKSIFKNLKSKSVIKIDAFMGVTVFVKNPFFEIIPEESLIVENLNKNVRFYLNAAVVENSKFIPLKISNLTSNNIIIRKNHYLGRISPFNSETISTLIESDELNLEPNLVSKFHESRLNKFFNTSTLPTVTVGPISDHQRSELNDLLVSKNKSFTHSKEDLGCIYGFRFGINPIDKTNINYTPPRTLPPGVRPEAEKEFNRWLSQELVEESTSDFNSPVLIIRKGDKKEARIVIDLRKVNQNTAKERTPIPNLHNMFYEIGVKIRESDDYFLSVADFSKAYHQLRLDSDSKKYSAFSFNKKSYQSNRLLYGFCNAPSTWTKMMMKIFEGLDIFIFFDDVIFVTKSFEEHMILLKEFLSRCEKYGLLLDPSKCKFCQKFVRIQGKRFDKYGRTPSYKHVKTISTYPTPTSKKSLK